MKFVGNKAKGRISTRVLQENKARQVFLNNNIFYPLIQWEMFVFRKIWHALFSCNTRVEIPPFALLTNEFFVETNSLGFMIGHLQ